MSNSPEQEIVHVVIGIIQNSQKEVLISKRMPDAHLGGLLEFPGGKVEDNESAIDALQRELSEELNITNISAIPLIQIPYHYSDRKILLDAYLIDKYSGCASANEGQEILWKMANSLNEDEFPAANFGVMRALQMPDRFPVTPNYFEDSENFLAKFERVVSKQSIDIIQLRSHDLNTADYLDLSKQCLELCSKYSVKLILNREEKVLNEIPASGIHLTSERLLNTTKRPLGKECLVGASCHNLNEVEHANSLKLDYIFSGPVIEKQHSENMMRLGWDGFAELSKKSVIPVYAIGGLKSDDVDACIHNGGQGVAAIRDFWNAGA